jgi:hypothetical protein
MNEHNTGVSCGVSSNVNNKKMVFSLRDRLSIHSFAFSRVNTHVCDCRMGMYVYRERKSWQQVRSQPILE